MWWCCGKRDYHAPGCKSQKHTTKDDKLDDDEKGNAGHKQIRCMCCKEFGHEADYCPKDPNIRTRNEPDEELKRVEQGLDENKKYLQDAQKSTIMMLSEFAKFKNSNKDNNEKAGGQFIMSFDDYQYKMANESILDMHLDNKEMKKAKKLDDEIQTESSEEDEEDEDEEDENNEAQTKKKENN